MPLPIKDRERMLASLIAPLLPKWGPAPEGSRCTACDSVDVERSTIAVGGPFAGSVRCLSCNHVESVVTHIGKTCFSVTPLPPEESTERLSIYERLLADEE